MEPEIREYDGFLDVELNEGQRLHVQRLAQETGLSIEIGEASIVVSYKGRDTNRWVVDSLVRLASIIENAEGEIAFEEEVEGAEKRLEFFTFHNGTLFRQLAQIVRGKTEIVES